MDIRTKMLHKFITCSIIIVASALILILSHFGVADSPDAMHYLGAAYNIVHTKSIDLPFGIWIHTPLTHFPPFYPLIVAFISELIGVSVFTGARLLQALLLGCNIVVMIYVVQRMQLFSMKTSYLFGLYFLFSIPYVFIHVAATSEPVMLLFGQLAFLGLYEYLFKKKFLYILVSILCLWCVTLTRYVGIAYPITIGIYLLFFTQSNSKTKLWYVGLVLASVIPILSWVYWTYTVNGRVANRVLLYHAIPIAGIQHAVSALGSWVNQFDSIPSLFLVLFCLLVYGYFFKKRALQKKNKFFDYVTNITKIFFLVYCTCVVIALLFFDAAISLDARMILPLQGIGVIYIIGVLARRFQFRKHSVLVYVFILISLFYVWSFVQWAKTYWMNGYGYASAEWSKSGLFSYIQQLDKDAVIYSNSPQLIFFYNQRNTYELPWKKSLTSGQQNIDYQEQITNVLHSIAHHQGWIIYFRGVSGSRLASEEEIASYPDVYPVFELPEGVVFGIK